MRLTTRSQNYVNIKDWWTEGRGPLLYFDRHWWLRAAGALGCAMYGAVLPVWYILLVVPLDLRHGLPVWTDSLAALGAVATLLVLAVLLWRSAGPARRRERLRRAARPNEQDAIPRFTPSRPWPSRTPARGPAALPLAIRFPEVLLLGPLLGLPGALIGGGGLVIAAMMLVVWPKDCAEELLARAPMPDPPQVVPFALGAAALAAVTFGALWFCLAVREYLAQPLSVVASDDGIRARAWWGRSRFIPWRELRLVEVSAYTDPGGRGGTSRVQVYTLHGQCARIRWHENVDWFGNVGEETAQLLDAVRARTGLEPRTFDRRLAWDAEAVRPRRRGADALRGARVWPLGAFHRGLVEAAGWWHSRARTGKHSRRTARDPEGAVLLEQLDHYLSFTLSTPTRRVALRIGRTVGFAAHAALRADVAAVRADMARLFMAPGKLLREGETETGVELQGVVPAGPGLLNLVLLTVTLRPRGSVETEVQVRGAAREGLISLRTAEHTVREVMAHLAERFPGSPAPR